METFPLLPIKKIGQEFQVAFFDPNEKQTQYHNYKEIDKAPLQLNEDTSVICWIIENTEGSTPGSYSRFWLTEKNREVIKMEQFFQGQYRYKVLQY